MVVVTPARDDGAQPVIVTVINATPASVAAPIRKGVPQSVERVAYERLTARNLQSTACAVRSIRLFDGSGYRTTPQLSRSHGQMAQISGCPSLARRTVTQHLYESVPVPPQRFHEASSFLRLAALIE